MPEERSFHDGQWFERSSAGQSPPSLEERIALLEAAGANSMLVDTVADLSKDVAALVASGMHVARFAPFKTLTGGNFDSSIRSALAAASALSLSPENGGAGTVNLLVPPGRWAMGDTLAFAGDPGFNTTPGLIGVGGPGTVALVWPSSLNKHWITLGNETSSGDLTDYSKGQTISNIELHSNGGIARKGGIKAWFSYRLSISDVVVRGLTDVGGAWDDGIGFDFREGGGSNHQHLRLTRCHADYCNYGYWFGRGVWSATLNDCHANGSSVAAAMYESAVLTWTGGNTQMGPSPVNYPHWNAGTRQAAHCSGAMHTAGLPSGTGATLSVASGQFCTLTGMQNMLGYRPNQFTTYKGMWIQLTHESPPLVWPGDRVSGLYRIHEVTGPDSCVLRKASDHAAAVGVVSYQVRGGEGGNNVGIEGLYHEAGAYALVSLGPDIVTSSRWDLESCEANNCDTVFESTGSQGLLRAVDTYAPGGTSAVLRRGGRFETDQPFSSVDADSVSRAGVISRYGAGMTGAAVVRDGRPRSQRYNRALEERGFVFGMDTRLESRVVKSGAAITTVQDFISGVVGTRINAGVAPQWTANDTEFEGPGIHITGGANAAAVGGLQWDLTSLFPAGKRYSPSLIAIAHLPNGTISGTNRLIRFSTAQFQATLAYHDGQYMGSGCYAVIYSLQLGGAGASSAPNLGNDTRAHIMAVTPNMVGRGTPSSASDEDPHKAINNFGSNYGWPDWSFDGGIAASLTIGEYFNSGVMGDLHVAHVALSLQPISEEETKALFDLARSEWRRLMP